MEYTRFRCANFSRRMPTNFFLHNYNKSLLYFIHLQARSHTEGWLADHTVHAAWLRLTAFKGPGRCPT